MLTGNRSSSVVVILLAMIVALATHHPSIAKAEVDGNTYISPNYGFTLEFGPSWVPLEDNTEAGVDYFAVSDFETIVIVGGGPAEGSPATELFGLITGNCEMVEVVECNPTLDENGEPIRVVSDQYASALYTQTIDGGDGLTIEMQVHFQVILIESNVSVVTIAFIPADTYASTGLTPIYELNDGFRDQYGNPFPFGMPSPDSGPAPDPLPQPSGGEPAPVIVNDFWRISIAESVTGEAIPALGLEPKDGRTWVAIVADVTNWSEVDAEFSLRDPLIQTAQMTEPWDIAPSSTRQVARLLGYTAQGNSSALIAAGETTRIVLVYSIPTGGSDATLLLGDTGMGIEPFLQLTIDPALLPEPVPPPANQSGTVIGVTTDSFGQVSVEVEGVGPDLVLIGVNIPSIGACYAEAALKDVIAVIGTNVEVEFDSAIGSDSAVYLWIAQSDGSLVQLNQQLLSQGSARYADAPSDSRFAAWLETSEVLASQQGVGLWSVCAN